MNLLPAAIGAGGGAGLLGAIGQVADAPRRLLWRDVLGLPETGSELVTQYTGLEGPWADALGFGAEIAGDPLTYAGALLGGGAGLLSKAAGAADDVGDVEALLRLRRGFPMVKDVQAFDTLEDAAKAGYGLSRRDVAVPALKNEGMLVGRGTGAKVDGAASRAVTEAMNLGDYARQKQARAGLDLHGQFRPNENVALTFAGTGADPVRVARHEALHGIINQAQKAGATADLPLHLRIPASMQQSSLGPLRALGELGEEMGVRFSDRRGAGLGTRLNDVFQFLDSANPSYGDLMKRDSPLLGALYNAGAFRPTYWLPAGAAGASAAAYGLLGGE